MNTKSLLRPKPWDKSSHQHGKSYMCGYCGNQVASAEGYSTQDTLGARILICPLCNFPTIFLRSSVSSQPIQIPDVLPGVLVPDVPESLASLYEEARASVAAGAFTASVLVCRKMLMDLAVEQGDEYRRGKQFFDYVKYLATTIFAPPHGEDWLNKIREQGNKATHELGTMSKDDALLLIKFIEMLLRMLYEFPALLVPITPEGGKAAPALRGNGPDPKPAGS